jgi:hypothetical protein
MGNIISGKKENPEDIKQVRQARTEFQDYLSQIQKNTSIDVNAKRLTPESGASILSEVKKGFDWLQKNPNANYSEVLAKYDAITAEIKRISSTDKPKQELKNMFTALKPIADDLLEKRKRIDETQAVKLKRLAEDEEKWYTKNSKTATDIDFSQEKLKMNDTIITIVPDSDVRKEIESTFNAVKDLSPGDLASLIAKAEADIKQKKDKEVNVKEGVNIILSTALKVFLILVLIVFCLMAGSLAANYAIGREPMYRIFYFIYGSIPLFSPLVYLYFIYKRIYEGPFSYYGFLPITTEPAISRLGKIAMYPFYWMPDHDSITALDNFQQSVRDATI